MLKLSKFMAKKRIEFGKDGKPVEIIPTLGGSIVLADLDEKTMGLIVKNVLEVLSEEELKDDALFMYKVTPYLFEELEVDITLDEFKYLIKYPKNHFELLIDMLMNEINGLFERAEKLNEIKANSRVLEERNIEIDRLTKEKEKYEIVQKPKVKKIAETSEIVKPEKCE